MQMEALQQPSGFWYPVVKLVFPFVYYHIIQYVVKSALIFQVLSSILKSAVL